MSEDKTIARLCAPTLAGLKTGSLYNYRYDDGEAMRDAIRMWNRRLARKGVSLIPLRYSESRALIYVFRPKLLRRDLCGERTAGILRRFGYAPGSCGECIARLIERIGRGETFPHEIGCFLGYPPEDVEGFIDNRAEGFKAVGYWKVYGDAEKASRTFRIYRRCTDWFCRRLDEGEALEQLAVAK